MMLKRTTRLPTIVLFWACLGVLAWGQTQARSDEPVPKKRETTVSKQTTKDGVTVTRTWQKSSEVVGRPITIHGENIGNVEDLVVDVNSGRVVYGVGSMSNGDRLYTIPWPAGRYSVQTKTYELPVETSQLQSAPTFTKTQWPNFADEEFATRTFKFYNQTPWWKSERTVVRTSDAPRSTTTFSTRWTQQPTTVHRITELRGRVIRTPDGVVLGPIDEFVLDPHNGRILYAVTSRDGASVPIPWSALRPVSDKEFEIAITADRWKSAPVIETQRWTTLSEPQWSQEVYRYYKVEPDWDLDDDDDDDDDDD